MLITEAVEVRFWRKIQVDFKTGCWLWTGSITSSGYGNLNIGRRVNQSAHVLSWVIHFGPIPEGLCVLHDCWPNPDNRKCVCPSHLWLGTKANNASDRKPKGMEPDRRGENHPQVKISEADVLKIRALRATEGMTYAEIGRRYGLRECHVRNIVLKLVWKHIL